jgi:sugar phosphate isomerase/epimerase
MKKFPLGIQLYTVREDCKKDFKGTLSTLAKLGYQGVEFAWNYGGMTPEQLAGFLKELDLKCCGLHAPLDPLLDAKSEWYAYAKAVHSPFITTSCAGDVAKDWKGTIEKIKQAGAVAQTVGLTFTYHNHEQEFEIIEGQYALDMLYAATDPQTVKAELDTYWIKKGGADPAQYIRKCKGRAPQIHLKDMDPADGSFTEVGAGIIALPAVFQAAEDAGARWMIYEQDVCKRPPLESVKITIENLRKAKLI